MSEAVAKAQAGTSIIRMMAERYQLEPERFLTTIKATIFPSGKEVSMEQTVAFLIVANKYELNPFVKEIYAFPGRGGGIVPIVSVDGWATLVNRQPMLDGIEFRDDVSSDGKLVAVTAIIYRKDRSHPTEVTEYMVECERNTDTWKQWPCRMLRHKALIQCARYAFGLTGIYDPDEAERIAGAMDTVQPEPPNAENLRQRLTEPRNGKSDVVDGEIVSEGKEASAEPETSQDAPESQETVSHVNPDELKQELRDHVARKLKGRKDKDAFLGERGLEGLTAATVDQLTEMIDELEGR